MPDTGPVGRRAMAGLVLAGALALAGCGHDDPGPQAERAYDGPLHVSSADATYPRAGAAGDAVDCHTFGLGGSSRQEVYDGGATAGSPQEALATARSERIYDGVQDGLAVAAQESDRVLYVIEVGGVIKQAVIVHDGPAAEGTGGRGWYVESWARCDLSELPRTYTDSIGVQTWVDAFGTPVPTRTVLSFTGPKHCNWQSMTFLELRGDDYVREPLPELADFFETPFRADIRLPADAIDTGYRRDGRHLWLAADRKQAFVGNHGSVEAWPRTAKPLGCA